MSTSRKQPARTFSGLVGSNSRSELLEYRPLALETLTALLEECPAGTRLRDVAAARDHFGLSGD